MIAAIARKEFSEIVRDGRFKWTAGIMALLLLTAMAAGYQKYSAYMDMQGLSQDRSNAQWLNQGDKNPHAGAHLTATMRSSRRVRWRFSTTASTTTPAPPCSWRRTSRTSPSAAAGHRPEFHRTLRGT